MTVLLSNHRCYSNEGYIHGNRFQRQRKEAMRHFMTTKMSVLVATPVTKLHKSVSWFSDDEIWERGCLLHDGALVKKSLNFDQIILIHFDFIWYPLFELHLNEDGSFSYLSTI